MIGTFFKKESHKQGPAPLYPGSRFPPSRRRLIWPLLVAAFGDSGMDTDFRLAADFLDHPKTIKLLIICEADGVLALLRLWGFAAKYRSKGILSRMTVRDIEIAAKWDGENGAFVAGAVSAGFLNKRKNGQYILHNWQKRNGWAFYSSDRSKQARKAASKKWGSPESNKQLRSQRLSAARAKGRHTKSEWEEMVRFFNNTCVRCQGITNLNGVVKDHITPMYQGGSDGIQNLQPLCAKCNAQKGSENYDYRVDYCRKHNKSIPDNWLNACGTPAERLLNACETSAPSPSPSPNPDPDPDPPPPPSSSSPLASDVDDFVKKYKEICQPKGLKKVLIVNSSRRGNIRQRLKELAQAGITVEEYMQRIADSPFLRGERGNWDGASFDFIIGAKNIGKILDGKYDRRENDIDWANIGQDNEEG